MDSEGWGGVRQILHKTDVPYIRAMTLHSLDRVLSGVANMGPLSGGGLDLRTRMVEHLPHICRPIPSKERYRRWRPPERNWFQTLRVD